MATVNLILSTYVLNVLWQIPVIAATARLCMKLANRLPAKVPPCRVGCGTASRGCLAATDLVAETKLGWRYG
jgi:hypothetical protein